MDTTTAVVETLRRYLGDDLLALYLYGSAVSGGLRPDSDLDFLAISRTPLDEAVRAGLTGELLRLSGQPRALEVSVLVLGDVLPWRYPPRLELQFGEWLRERLEAGRIAPPAADPDVAVLLASAWQESRTLHGPPLRELLQAVPTQDLRRAIRDDLPRLMVGVRGDERNVLLTLARMWLTLTTDTIQPKDQAALWALPRLPPEHRAALELALRGYRGECRDDWRGREAQVDALVIQLRREIDAC